MIDKGVLSEDKIAGLDSEIEEEIQSAIDRAEAQMKTLGDPIDMFKHTYAEMPPFLKEQKEAFAGELVKTGEDEHHG